MGRKKKKRMSKGGKAEGEENKANGGPYDSSVRKEELGGMGKQEGDTCMIKKTCVNHVRRRHGVDLVRCRGWPQTLVKDKKKEEV